MLLSLFLLSLVVLLASAPAFAERQVSCLGRLEPGLGVVRVATPSVGSGVIATLLVSEGEQVERGTILATLDDHALRVADVERIKAELDNARREANRARTLSKRSVTSAANLDAAEIDLRIAKSNLDAANARLELTRIRAPIKGQILEIHAREGERVGSDGVLEMGDTEKMFAVAEVYETDIATVKEGQRATIRSAALASPISGVVEKIGLKIGRMDVLDTDPIAKADSRVVEVRIALDSSEVVSRLTNLQVEIEIETEP
jgi:HlyD family secretion protein